MRDSKISLGASSRGAMPRGGGRFLSALLIYALLRGLLLVWVVPAWQGPDEPSHMEYLLLSAEQGWPRRTDLELQAHILDSMREARWHDWLELDRPASPPRSFDDLARLSDSPSQVGNETPLGYLPYLPASQLALPRGLSASLRAARATSVFLTLLLIAAAWWTVSLARFGHASPQPPVDPSPSSGAFGSADRQGLALAVLTALLVATAPMLGFTGSMLGNDLPAALLTCLWMALAFRAFHHGGPGRSALPLTALALLAGLSKRSALFLLPLCAILLAGERGTRRLLTGSLVALLAAAWIAAWPLADRPAGWDRVGRDWGAERRPEAARSGRLGLRIVDDQPDAWQYLEQWIAVEPGSALRFEAWVRRAGGVAGDGRGGPEPRAQLVVNSEADDWWGQTVELDRDWQELVVELRVPAGIDRLRVAIVPGAGTAEGMAALDADDLQVTNLDSGRAAEAESSAAERPTPGDVPTPRLRNGGAERARRLGDPIWQGVLRYTAAPRLLAATRSGLLDPAGSLATARRGLGFLFDSFWGGFGWLNVWPGGGYYRLARVLTVWVLMAWLVALLRPAWLAGRPGPEARALRLCALAAPIALALAIFGSMAGTELTRLAQGRYLLPALPAFALPAAALSLRVAPRLAPVLLALAALALDLLAVFGVIWPFYGREI